MESVKIYDPNGFMSRQHRMGSVMDLEKLRELYIAVVGAGAIGAAAVTILVNTGVRHLTVVDMDIQEKSNYSRSSFLYRYPEDLGRPKAEAAAERAMQGMLDGGNCKGICADITKLGYAFFKQFDYVICCVDSMDARAHISEMCRLANVPWIESGTTGLKEHVQLFDHSGPCYECNKPYIRQVKRRYSCAAHYKAAIDQSRIPATAIASTAAGNGAVQLMINHLRGNDIANLRYCYDAGTMKAETISLSPNPRCVCRDRKLLEQPPEPIAIETDKDTLGEALLRLEAEYGEGTLLMAAESFVTHIQCPVCGQRREINLPISDIWESDRICTDCRAKGKTEERLSTDDYFIGEFSRDTEAEYKNMLLKELGFRSGGIIALIDGDGGFHHRLCQLEETYMAP